MTKTIDEKKVYLELTKIYPDLFDTQKDKNSDHVWIYCPRAIKSFKPLDRSQWLCVLSNVIRSCLSVQQKQHLRLAMHMTFDVSELIEAYPEQLVAGILIVHGRKIEDLCK